MPTPTTIDLVTKLEALDPEVQKELVEIGEQFSTEDVLRQAAKFTKSWSVSQPPKRYGFNAADAAALLPLTTAISDISGVRITNNVTRATERDDFRDTITSGKRALSGGRTVLENGDKALQREATDSSKATRSLIRATTDKLGKTGRSKTRLLSQLNTIRTTLQDTNLAAVLTDRGGPEALADIEAAIADLGGKTAPAEKVRGNPVETRQLNLLEGHAVNILRQARAAARDWSLARRNPALAKPYELDLLYATGPTHAEAEPTTTTTTPSTTPATP